MSKTVPKFQQRFWHRQKLSRRALSEHGVAVDSNHDHVGYFPVDLLEGEATWAASGFLSWEDA